MIVIKIMVGSRLVVMRMKMTHPPTFGDKREFVYYKITLAVKVAYVVVNIFVVLF